MKPAALATALLTAIPALAQPLTMEPVTIKDPMIYNMDAVQFLKPKGWKVRGGLQWYADSAHQVCLELKVSNPDGPEQIEFLPWSYATWLTNPVFPMAEGSNYMGKVVRKPIPDPRDVVETLTLPKLRAAYRPKVTGYLDMPELAKVHAAGLGGGRVKAGRVRVEYVMDGQAVEEDFYVSIFVTSADIGNNCTSYIWGPAAAPFSFRAARGKLDAATPLMLAAVNSGRVEPLWFGQKSYVCDLFANRMNQGIANAKTISDTVTRNSNEVFKMYSDAYWSRQASQERVARGFSDYIRGVQRYASPYDKYPVQLPSGYKYAWTSATGGVILSNEAGFDPNAGGTRSWQLMKEAR